MFDYRNRNYIAENTKRRKELAGNSIYMITGKK
jgi:hypothetical protein